VGESKLAARLSISLVGTLTVTLGLASSSFLLLPCHNCSKIEAKMSQNAQPLVLAVSKAAYVRQRLQAWNITIGFAHLESRL
jgi:hypothetical protein